MAVSELLFELGVVMGIAALLALIGRAVKQPTIIAYLIAGILVGPLFFGVLKSHELIEIFAELGVTFLLFIVGLSLDFRVLKQVGKVALTIGVAQVLITSIAGFFIALAFGFSTVPAMFLAAALAFSSTIFVLNLLSEKKDLDTLHGKISLGILIVQDFIVVIALIFMPAVGDHGFEVFVWASVLKAILLIVAVFLISHLAAPKVLKISAQSQEVLFLFSIGWAFVVALIFSQLGLSVELGALIGGMALASSRFSLEISSKVKSLREFFVIIHLVFFGSLLVGPISWGLMGKAVVFSLLVLIGNPLIIMSFMKAFGFKKRTGFLTGVSIAQISEFSLILVFIGFTAGVVAQDILNLTILIALITITLSSYGIYYSKSLYKFLSPLLGSFDGHHARHYKGVMNLHNKYDVVLFGYNRIGYNLLKTFKKSKKKYLVVDYDPEIISNLRKRGVPCVYGDADDEDFLKELSLRESKTVISTIPDLEINIGIMRSIGNKRTIFIPTSHSISDTRELYERGADYVIMPHFLGGHFMGHLIGREDFDKKLLRKHSDKHLKELHEREFEGHAHPNKDKHGR